MKWCLVAFFVASICTNAFAQEKNWIVQKWLNNCENRVQNALNFAFGPLVFRRWNFSETEIVRDCKTTLNEIATNFHKRKSVSYSIRYFLDGVTIDETMRAALKDGIKTQIRRFFGNDIVVTDHTDAGAIDIGFFIYISSFTMDNTYKVYYGRIEGNFYFNDLYNVEYPVGVAYDGRVDLIGGLVNDIEVIVRDYAAAFASVLAAGLAK